MNIKYSKAMKEIQLEAKNNGMVFKCQNATINGAQAYKFTNRKTGETIISNCTVWSAYALYVEGVIASNKQ